MIEVAIGIGLFLSIIFSEALGLAAGGMVVPGYLALELDHVGRLLTTLVIALAALGGVKVLSLFMLIYGRRRTAIIILLGFLLRALAEQFLQTALPAQSETMASIGYIIPGLIAIWMERQGILETISTGVVAAVMVKLCLIFFLEVGVL